MQARKKEEQRIGGAAKSIDAEGIKLIEPLAHRGNERMKDVLEWLKQLQAVRKGSGNSK